MGALPAFPPAAVDVAPAAAFARGRGGRGGVGLPHVADDGGIELVTHGEAAEGEGGSKKPRPLAPFPFPLAAAAAFAVEVQIGIPGVDPPPPAAGAALNGDGHKEGGDGRDGAVDAGADGACARSRSRNRSRSGSGKVGLGCARCGGGRAPASLALGSLGLHTPQQRHARKQPPPRRLRRQRPHRRLHLHPRRKGLLGVRVRRVGVPCGGEGEEGGAGAGAGGEGAAAGEREDEGLVLDDLDHGGDDVTHAGVREGGGGGGGGGSSGKGGLLLAPLELLLRTRRLRRRKQVLPQAHLRDPLRLGHFHHHTPHEGAHPWRGPGLAEVVVQDEADHVTAGGGVEVEVEDDPVVPVLVHGALHDRAEKEAGRGGRRQRRGGRRIRRRRGRRRRRRGLVVGGRPQALQPLEVGEEGLHGSGPPSPGPAPFPAVRAPPPPLLPALAVPLALAFPPLPGERQRLRRAADPRRQRGHRPPRGWVHLRQLRPQ